MGSGLGGDGWQAVWGGLVSARVRRLLVGLVALVGGLIAFREEWDVEG